jgi:hypothetical protein
MTPAHTLSLKAAIIGAYLPGSPTWFAAAIAAAVLKARETKRH